MKTIISKELGAINNKIISFKVKNIISYELSYKGRFFYYRNNGIKTYNDFKYNNNKFYYRDTFCKKFVLDNLASKQFSNIIKIESNFQKISMSSDFMNLITESSIIVDKTPFIKEILEDKAEVLLITMPRRFGKSLNLNMLYRFLSVEVDEKGNKIINSQNKNHNLFAGGKVELINSNVKIEKVIKKSELIANNPDLLALQGQFPVIFIDLKDCNGESLEIIKENLRKKFLKTILEFSYLGKSKKKFEDSNIGKKYNKLLKNLNSYYEADAIKELSSLLYDYHNKHVWILIDEYDSTANYALFNFTENESKKVLELLKRFYSITFKGNFFLDKGIITGIQYIIQGEMTAGLNNITKHNYNSIKYSKYYGIDENEMNQLFNHFNIDAAKRLQIKNWYIGYKSNIGTSEKPIFIDKYNTWSIVNYLNNQAQGFVSYWEYCQNANSFLKNLFKYSTFTDNLNDLINGKSIDIGQPDENFNLNEFFLLKDIQNDAKHVRWNENVKSLILSYLLVTGYLTKNELGKLQLPNQDLKSVMENYLDEHYRTLFTFPEECLEKIITILDSVFDKEVKEISNIFVKKFGPEFFAIIEKLEILDKSDFENFKNGIFENKNLMHILMSFIAFRITKTQYAGEKYVSTTNGKKDRVYIFSSKNGRGMIIEMKFNNGSQNDIVKANEALNQAKRDIELLERDDIKIFVGCIINKDKKVFLSGEIIIKDNNSILFSYP